MATVVLLASLGRNPSDFAALSAALLDGGHDPHPFDPAPGADLHEMAAVHAAAIERLAAGGPVDLVGHAFGNRLARVLAADRPDLVRSVILLAAGGQVAPTASARRDLLRCFDTSLAPEDHLESVRAAFFAPGGDASVWRSGWDADLARHQAAAVAATTDHDTWMLAGNKPTLVIQGLDDVIAVPENGRVLRDAAPETVTLVELEGAGHALLPERPRPIAERVLAWFAAIAPA